MAVMIDAINFQVDHSIYENPSTQSKYQLASQCDLLKKIAIVVVIATPIFAFFLPHVYGIVSCLALGLVGYDVFNIADNLGDAAKQSAEGGNPPSSGTNIDLLVDGTILANALYKWSKPDAASRPHETFHTSAEERAFNPS